MTDRDPSPSESRLQTPLLTDAELVQLQVRTIALESVVVALLAESTPEQLARVRAMAAHILPRTGHTAHWLTTHAATAVGMLLDRAASAPR